MADHTVADILEQLSVVRSEFIALQIIANEITERAVTLALTRHSLTIEEANYIAANIERMQSETREYNHLLTMRMQDLTERLNRINGHHVNY